MHAYLKLGRVCEGGQNFTPSIAIDKHWERHSGSVIDTWRHRHTGVTHCTRVKGVWPPLHIPIVVGRSGGLLDLRDIDVTIILPRLPTLGGLFDLPGLALGGCVLDLYVYVSHGNG